MKKIISYTLAGLCVLPCLAGCTAFELDTLVPTAALSFAASDGIPLVTACDPWTTTRPDKPEIVAEAAKVVKTNLPVELASDAVVNSVVDHAKHVTNRSASYVAAAATSAGATIAAPPVMPPPTNTLSPVDFARFTQLVTKHVFRRMTLTSDGLVEKDPFWVKLKAYYLEYFKGNFRSYFGEKYPAPSPSLTIDDAEIVKGVSVFVEFLLDEVFQSTVWYEGQSKTYYPGGNGEKPTFLVVNHLTAKNIPASTSGYGCGMNTFKAGQVRYLAAMFSKAAATETSLAVKSAGSIEIGLGVVGKLNIGDNSTLTLLVQAAVSEIVGRLTAQLAVPVLSALDFEPNPPVVAEAKPVRTARAKTMATELSRAETARAMTSLFVGTAHAL